MICDQIITKYVYYSPLFFKRFHFDEARALPKALRLDSMTANCLTAPYASIIYGRNIVNSLLGKNRRKDNKGKLATGELITSSNHLKFVISISLYTGVQY